MTFNDILKSSFMENATNLSIVRFRSAIKEPLDIAFLFWSISIGIVSGAGLISLAVFGSVFIGIIMVLFINKDSNYTI